jgi:hypothetical protein
MGLTAVIKRLCTQTAVYWGNPVSDHHGGFTFDSPVELAPPDNGVRWEEMEQLITDKDGTELTSRAVIYCNQDLDEEGMLYLGTLDDLDSNEAENPKLVEAAYYIKRFQKTPDLKGTGVLRKAFLTPSLSFGGQ